MLKCLPAVIVLNYGFKFRIQFLCANYPLYSAFIFRQSDSNEMRRNQMKPCVFLSALILFAFILFPTMCPAVTAADEIKFENLTIEDGLSQSSVFAILQDKRGLMWFGTWDGLNRYDGYRFTIYKYNEKNPYSLSNNEIRALYEDRKGELWIGTMEGLNWFICA